mmetsp:Transcript_4494/g.13187  ORF Transcript_4494/g.13187 Transcript_4494/m.13187 type:complete len:233 (-) Transcript_4494:74-772(-)
MSLALQSSRQRMLSTARPKSTMPKLGPLAPFSSTRMFRGVMSRWKARAEMCSSAGASWASRTHTYLQASAKVQCRRSLEEARSRSSRSRTCSRGVPKTRVIASRTRHCSGPMASTSEAMSAGTRRFTSMFEPSPKKSSRPRNWRNCLSEAARSSSASDLHSISLTATSPQKSSSADHTAPKLPSPRRDPTRKLRPPIRTWAPLASGALADGLLLASLPRAEETAQTSLPAAR